MKEETDFQDSGANSWGMVTDILMDKFNFFYGDGQTESSRCMREFNDSLHILKGVGYKCRIICKVQVMNSLHNHLSSCYQALLVEQPPLVLN